MRWRCPVSFIFNYSYVIIMLFIVIGVGRIGIVNHELLFRPPYYRTES